MANINVTILPRNQSEWKRYYRGLDLQDHEKTTIFNAKVDLNSGSKIDDIGFALLRIYCRRNIPPFEKGKPSKSSFIVHQKYLEKAERTLSESKAFKEYINRVRHNPHMIARGSKGEKLGSYHPLHVSQVLTQRIPDQLDDRRSVNFSPIITKQKLRKLDSAALDEANRQSRQFQSALGLDSLDPHQHISLLQNQQQLIPQTPPRQTQRDVRSPDAMDTDQSFEWVGTTSSRSVEQPSPISGYEAKGGPILDTEQETVMNGALSVRTPTDMYEELEDVVWSLY